jgi:hypothetical protein
MAAVTDGDRESRLFLVSCAPIADSARMTFLPSGIWRCPAGPPASRLPARAGIGLAALRQAKHWLANGPAMTLLRKAPMG